MTTKWRAARMTKHRRQQGRRELEFRVRSGRPGSLEESGS